MPSSILCRLSLLLVAAAVCLAARAADTPPAAPAPAVAAPAAKPVTFALKPGLRVAIVGDSITEQKLYSAAIEAYLLACMPQLQLTFCQFGWSGERAAGFAARMDNDLKDFKPDVVTLCYGMNDGGYRAYEPAIGKAYEGPLRDIVARVLKAGGSVIVGGPGVVDSKYFARGNTPGIAKVYNDSLAQLSGIAKAIAAENGQPHANVHGAMLSAMDKAKAALGPDYDVAGRDGVHPGPNGHILMAYAFLKAMGLDGDLGSITVDMKGTATAENGHKVLTSQGGKVELESSRYPFCFYGDEKSSGGTRSILPFCSFNDDLNRLTLTVKNLDAATAKVTWGSAAKEFTRDELAQGVNLAAAFPDNPFSQPFQKVAAAVAAKQAFETQLIKNVITSMPAVSRVLDDDPDAGKAQEVIRAKLWAKHAKLAAGATAAAAPVKHALAVEAVP